MSNESDEPTPAGAAASPPAAPPPAAPPPAPYGEGPFSPPPPPPEGYGAGPMPPPPAAAPAGPSSRVGFLGGRLLRVVIVAIIVIVIGVVYGSLRGKPNAASAPGQGSCISAEDTNSNHPKIHKVDCSDPKAQYTVLSKISGGDDSACDNVPGTDASYTETNHSKPIYVLCLQQTK